jgi:death-on-curing protein
MISLKDVESIHQILIQKFGGSPGIHDYSLLESAINRPYQTFDQQELYPTAAEKAAAIFESIVANHPLVDGNKRTSYVLMRIILLEGDLDLKVSEDEKYDFVISAAKGELDFLKIKNWIEMNSNPVTK